MAPASETRVIVFSHANGFPAGTYRQLFEAWRAAGYAIHAPDRLGHDPSFPVTSNWPHLRSELIQFIEREVGGPAHLVGHSLGGFLSTMVASRRPDLALGVVMLDSPILAGWKARALQFAKATGVGERFSPAHVAKRRRQEWAHADAALKHFEAKPAFARWAPGVLRNYIEAGTETVGGVQRLRFDRDVEASIYNALPHHLARVLRAHPLRCPLALVRGTESREVRQVGLAASQRLTHGRVSSMAGSHLFPLERPADAAAEVLRWLEAMHTLEVRPEP